ncbi:SH3 domain-containing protein [Exiguobacterium sp. s196]|uniref:SH3 domain-containing protein n=1 Tax=Exiguobacterium sp. s196 TaxID=2751283 RepID=UPI001BEBFE64|nr:SH3 domain-containing protein [Exiguobacterium sp. s196]
MKILKAIMTGVLSVLLLSTPIGGSRFDSGISKVEASTQMKAMYAKKVLPAYESPSTKSKESFIIPYGARVDRLATKSSWTKIEYDFVSNDSIIGWVPSRDLGEIKKSEVLDTKKVVTLYASRSTKAKVITKVPANKQVSRLATNKSWSQIKYGARTGWVASTNLTLRYNKETFALKKYHLKESAPLQSSYSNDSDIIATLPKDRIVASVERYNNWYKVTLDNQTGWVKSKYLKKHNKETIREVFQRTYGNSYKVFIDFYVTARKSNDILSVQFNFNPMGGPGDASAILKLDHKKNKPQKDEFLKAAKIITTFYGGNSNRLADEMFELYTADPMSRGYIIYDKYKIRAFGNSIYVNWGLSDWF